MISRREKALLGLPPETRSAVLARAADLGVTHTDDLVWELIALAVEADIASETAKSVTASIPSQIQRVVQESGRKLANELTGKFERIARSKAVSQKMIAFSSAAGIVLIAMIAGAVFCGFVLAQTGHLNMTDYRIWSTHNGTVKIQAPRLMRPSWCEQKKRDCLEIELL